MKVVDGASIPAIFIDCEPHIAEMLDDDLRRIVPALEIHLSQPENEDEIIARLQGHALAMVYMAYLSERILSACRELECVIYLSTGIATHVDLAAARRLNITVRGVEGYGNRAVAEHTIALMFAAARRVTEMDRALREGRWCLHRGIELQNRTLGLIGLGGVGSEVARLGDALGMSVVAWNRSGIPEGLPCKECELDEVLKRSNVVSLHVRLTDETRCLINAHRIQLLRPDAILVNTARAEIVDEVAMMDALVNRRIGGAALDVFHEEPLPYGHALTEIPNVVLSTHSAWYTPEAIYRVLKIGLERLREEIDRRE